MVVCPQSWHCAWRTGSTGTCGGVEVVVGEGCVGGGGEETPTAVSFKVGSPGDSLAYVGLWDVNLGDQCLHGEQEIQQNPGERAKGSGRQDWVLALPKAARFPLGLELTGLRVLRVFFPGGCFAAFFCQGKVGRGETVQGEGEVSYALQVTSETGGTNHAFGVPGGRLEAGFTRG